MDDKLARLAGGELVFATTSTVRTGVVMSKRPSTALKRPRQPMPSFVREAIEKRKLIAAYHARPAYQRNDYLLWINAAKSPATKEKRLQQMLDELADGRSYMRMPWRAK